MLRRLLHCFVLIVLAAALASACASTARAPGAAQDESERLHVWLEQKYEERLDFSPMRKTSLGRRDDYDQIDDYSEAGGDRVIAWSEGTVAELERDFDYALLNADARISYDLWIFGHERAIRAREFRRRGYVFNQMSGAHTSLPQFLITQHLVETEADMVAYVSRLHQTGRALRQSLERAQLAAAQDVHAPWFAAVSVIGASRAIISGAPFAAEGDAASSPLLADADSKIGSLVESGEISAARADELKAEARTALTQSVGPAYQAIIDWFASELPQSAVSGLGVWSLPDGEAYYAERLAAMTTTDLDADTIHELGLSEVARIHAEMEVIRQSIGFDGSLQDLFAYMREDDRFFLPDTDEGRQGYLDRAREHLGFIEALLPEYFGLLPKAELEVRRVEAYRESPGQAQHYQRGSPDGSRPGIYYAHLSDMRAMPIPMMEVIAYHEGMPGHHMQLSIAQELTGMPTFRRQYGETAYAEGWGLYAEQLAWEMGAYQDPYSNLGRLTSELWRAIRLVVDTGLHDRRWSEQQAVNYMLENSAISEGQIRSEVQRYIVMPGQATSYKIGMMKILELREASRAALGDDFDIADFHDIVLGGGALPLSLLERRVSDWLAAGS